MLKVTQLKRKGFETVVVGKDPSAGLHALIAVHNTQRGPALGGIRMWPYRNAQEALNDVLRLAPAMTAKAAISGLQLGGGKAVMIGDPLHEKTRELFLSMGEFIESLRGTYFAAEDSGIAPEDLDIVREKTEFVTGTTVKHGGSGDPSLSTAKGVLAGMRAASQLVFGTKSLQGRRVSIQGVGQVGWNLGNLLYQQGAKLIVSDLHRARVKRAQQAWKASAVALSKIHQVHADIFAPCALGGVLNRKTIPQLRVKIVAGGANNQFQDETQDAKRLMSRQILHVPDYVLNAGGLIHLYVREILRERRLAPWFLNIEKTVRQVLSAALQEQLPPLVVANRLVQQTIRSRRLCRS